MVITYKKFKDFEKQWVAIDEEKEEIIASGNNLIEIESQIEKMESEESNIVIWFIPPFNQRFSL